MLAKDWWTFAVRGIAAIVFGIAAFAWPEQTVTVLTWLFGLYLLVDGISMLGAVAFGDPIARRSAWAVVLMGLVSIGFGIASFVWTDTVALSLLYVIAFWAIVVGTLQAIAAYQFRREIEGEVWMGIGGILTVVFGRTAGRVPGRRPDLAGLAHRPLGDCVGRVEPRPGLPVARAE
jgi:uncharacterized membrane protein HdeD (DUF308 family)